MVLAIVAIEPHAGLGQRVKVRRLCAKPVAVAAELYPHVIGHEEQHVGPARDGRLGFRQDHLEHSPH